MNYDIVKNTLLEIIKEAKNLPESELEVIPGTSIKVKKGKVKEFDVNAYFYFEHEYNMNINENIDYITDVYNMLEQEVKEENNEYYISKAYDIDSVNKDNIKRLDALNKSLETINANYIKLSKSANDLRNRLSDEDYSLWKDKFDKINNDISELAQNRSIIHKAIVSIKNDVNEKLVNSIKEQMALIEDNFKNTLYGTSVGYALNGESVLASDLEEYNCLISIIKLLNEVTENEKIVSCYGAICVNERQLEETKKLFNKVNVFSRLKTKEVTKNVVNLNDDLINKIITELRNIEDKSKRAKKKNIEALNGVRISENLVNEYNNLLNILKILNQAKDSKWEIVNVYGIANVKSEDRAKFEELIKDTKYFKDVNPDSKKIEENQKIVKELRKYLSSLEQKLNKYNGVANIPSRKTNDDTIVLKEDLHEYNTILEIITLLENSNNKLINVWNVGNVSYDNVSKFKKLVNATKYYSSVTPTIEENEVEINNIKNELKEMILKAKNANDAVLALNGVILESDSEKYKLLEEKYSYLDGSKASDNLVEVNGVKIDDKYVKRYLEIEEKLSNLNNDVIDEVITIEKGDEPIILPPEIEVINEVEPIVVPPIVDPLSGLEQTKEETTKPLNKTLDNIINNPIDADYTVINDKENNVNKLKKKVVGVRKANSKALKTIKENWKTIVVVGLSIAVVTLVLSELAPILIYANSCNAAAMPWASGFFNGLSSVIAKFGGIKFLNGAFITQSGSIINLGAVASKAFLATLQAMGALGLIGASFVVANKAIKKESTNKLSNPDKKSIIDKIRSLYNNFKEKRVVEVIERENVDSNYVVEALNSENIKLNNDLLNAKIEYDSHQEYAGDQKEVQERMEERIAKMNLENDVDVVQEKPIIALPSDEEIIESLNSSKTSDNAVLEILHEQAARVQEKLIAGKISESEKLVLEQELEKINDRIDNLQKNERGM